MKLMINHRYAKRGGFKINCKPMFLQIISKGDSDRSHSHTDSLTHARTHARTHTHTDRQTGYMSGGTNVIFWWHVTDLPLWSPVLAVVSCEVLIGC